MDKIFIPAFIEATVAIIRCWLNKTSKRDESNGYRDQEVDKLALLYVCARNKNDPQPFTIQPGIYGHGLAVVSSTRGSIQFFPRALRLLLGLHAPVEDEHGMLPPDESAPFKITKSGFGYHFLPLKGDSWCDGLAGMIDPESSEFATEFSQQVAAFNSKQIIALGRHIDANYTKRALNYLLDRTRHHVQELGVGAQEPEIAWRQVRRIYEMGRSQRIKVFDDPEHYEGAWNDLAGTRADGNSAVEAILNCRHAPQRIWRSADLSRWRELAESMYAFSKLLWTGFQISNHGFSLVGRTSPSPREEFDKAWHSWSGLDRLHSFPAAEIADGRFMDVRTQLGASLASFVPGTQSY